MAARDSTEEYAIAESQLVYETVFQRLMNSFRLFHLSFPSSDIDISCVITTWALFRTCLQSREQQHSTRTSYAIEPPLSGRSGNGPYVYPWVFLERTLYRIAWAFRTGRLHCFPSGETLCHSFTRSRETFKVSRLLGLYIFAIYGIIKELSLWYSPS